MFSPLSFVLRGFFGGGGTVINDGVEVELDDMQIDVQLQEEIAVAVNDESIIAELDDDEITVEVNE